MELEDKILAGAALVGALSVFMPWFSGEWLGGPPEHYSGFGFFHAFLGWGVFLLNLIVLALSLPPSIKVRMPLTLRQRICVRLIITIMITTLALASLSILARISFESTRMDIRFGVYVTIVCGIITAFYAWLRMQEMMRKEHREHFMHPEDPGTIRDHRNEPHSLHPPSPPPPPPPLPPEEHRRYR